MHIARLHFCLVVLIALNGCVSVDPVAEADGVSAVSPTDCKALELTRHCNWWTAASLTIRIDEDYLDVSTNDDGHRVFLERTGGGVFADGWLGNPFVLNRPRLSRQTNRLYDVVKDALSDEGVNITKVTPVRFAGDIVGYLLDLDGDGFSVLMKFKVGELDDA